MDWSSLFLSFYIYISTSDTVDLCHFDFVTLKHSYLLEECAMDGSQSVISSYGYQEVQKCSLPASQESQHPNMA